MARYKITMEARFVHEANQEVFVEAETEAEAKKLAWDNLDINKWVSLGEPHCEMCGYALIENLDKPPKAKRRKATTKRKKK